MKPKYEISVWEDVFSQEDNCFHEQKIIIIGSDTMTSQNRAREPKMINNINGTNKFSFNLYYSYIDNITGEKVKNPYVQYLVNERKIKVLWKDKWYDFIVKQIKEDQVNHVFTYTCEDAFITELSRTGFNLTFATELENNIGTARELVEKVIEDTDWQFDEDSDTIYQKIDEPVYEVQIVHDFQALQNPENTGINIYGGHSALVYYSCAPDINNLKTSLQFYYSESGVWEQDENDMLVINGKCCSVGVTWQVNDTKATALVNGNPIFMINFATGLSINYRAERYVQSQKTVYNNIVDRYVNVYNDGALLGYSSTEFNDALAVVNLVTNPSNFSNTSGWIGEGLFFKLSPAFGPDTDVSTYTATSYLYLPEGTYYNTGIQNNRPYIPDGFTIGENYVLRIRARMDGDEPALAGNITSPNFFNPSIQSRRDYDPTGTNYFRITNSFYDEAENWIEYDMTCIKSCPYEMILSTTQPFGIFLQTSATCWLQEIQFFREIYGNTGKGKEVVRINPGEMSRQAVAQTWWKYFNADQEEGVAKDTLPYVYKSLREWERARPVYNNYERYGTIEESQSNRFNILQSIAEAFECWVYFNVEHDENGYITYKDGKLQKFITLRRENGQETGIGFVYGIDLKSITRDVKSDKISTKTIVEQNENEFGENGFCTIARSEQNYPRENIIYNFDYYIQQGLLSKDVLYNDLYNATTGLKYYPTLHDLNVKYAKNLDSLSNKKIELTRQNATATVYNQYILSSKEELQSVEESIMKLAGVTNINAGLEYARTHYRDTKVQSLVNDRSIINETLRIYQDVLNPALQNSLKNLNESIKDLNTHQGEIIDELTALNKAFYIKYARFIQEGTWTSEDYWNDDLYYLDAVQVAYTSSRPQISYDINVLRLSDLDEYSSKVFRLGDISFVQDTEYFGYLDDHITPYKEKVILTEITSYFDTPDKDTIKVQNYKTQFDDLFQRITAQVQNLEFNQGKYAKAASIVTTDGTIRSSVIQNTFNENKDLVYGAQNESATIDNTGITVTDNANAAKQVKVTSGGVFVTDDGGVTWKNAIRGDGISTDLLTAGRINTEQITVYNGSYPSFRWDPNGLNAYKFTEIDADNRPVDTTQFVRFDQYGIYGIKGASEDFNPTEAEIYEKANFGLTWNRFFMRSQENGKYIEISTDRDIVVNDGKTDRVVIGRVDGALSDNYGIRVRAEAEKGQATGEIIFQCDNNGSYLSGWTLTKDFLQSTPTADGQSIQIQSNGNIGCYGHEATSRLESVYTTQVSHSFLATGLNTENREFVQGDVIYVFVSSVGKTKTVRQVGGEMKSEYLEPGTEYTPTPPSTIQISVTSGNSTFNYEVSDVKWTVTKNKTVPEEKTIGTTSEKITTYTYYFDLTASKNNFVIFALPYTATFVDSKEKYVPAAKTKWYIDNNGDAIFHEIYADGGSIAGWWIDNEKIYQTTNGRRDGPIKTQLNSAGTATSGGFDYTIITDAINAAMASIGGVLMSGGLINGYSIAAVAAQAANAENTATSALSKANDASTAASNAASAAANAMAYAKELARTVNWMIEHWPS